MWANKFRIVKAYDSDGDEQFKVQSTRLGLFWLTQRAFSSLYRAENLVESMIRQSRKQEILKEYKLGKGEIK